MINGITIGDSPKYQFVFVYPKSDNNDKHILWHYRLWIFLARDTKVDRFLPKNQHAKRKLLNFENWVNGKVSKIGHHFRK